MKKYILIVIAGLVILGNIKSAHAALPIDYFLKGLEKSKKFYVNQIKKLKKYLAQKGLMEQQKMIYATALEKQQEHLDYYQKLINDHKRNPQKSIAASKKRSAQAKESNRLPNLYNQLTNKRNRLNKLKSSSPGSAEISKVKKEITNIENEIIKLESR